MNFTHDTIGGEDTKNIKILSRYNSPVSDRLKSADRAVSPSSKVSRDTTHLILFACTEKN